MISIHEIKLEENDKFSKSFNICSELFKKAMDKNLTEEERKEAFEEYTSRKIALEMGF